MKVKLRILNFFYFAFAAAAIFFYVTNPFLQIYVECEITADDIADVVDDSFTNDFGITPEDLFTEESSIEFDLRLNLNTTTLLQAWQTNVAVDYFNDAVIGPALVEIIDDLEPVLESVARSAIKGMVSYVMMEDLDGLCGAGEDVYKKLGTAGYSEGSIDNALEYITDAILEDDEATTTTICTAFADKYNTFATAIGGSEKSVDEVENELGSYLLAYAIVDEDGDVTSINQTISSILRSFIKIEESESDDDDDWDDDDWDDDWDDWDEDDSPNFARKLFAPLFGSDDYEFDEDTLGYTLMELIDDIYLGEDSGYTPIILMATVRGFGILFVLFVLCWAIKIIQCIASLFRKTPYVRVNPVGVVTGVIEVFLSAITILMTLFFTIQDTEILESIPLLGGLVAMPVPGMTAQLIFSSYFPGIIVIVNMLFSIVYGAVKTKFKKDYRQEMDEDY